MACPRYIAGTEKGLGLHPVLRPGSGAYGQGHLSAVEYAEVAAPNRVHDTGREQ